MSVEMEIFWGNINVDAESKAKAILNTQAANLGKLTKNVVEATVTTDIVVDDKANGFMNPPIYSHCFVIMAPILGYQRFTLFCIEQTVGIEYPLKIASNYWNEEAICECNTEDALKDCLKKILGSEKTTHLIESIIAQSK